MDDKVRAAAKANAQYAMKVITRAAEILVEAHPECGETCYATEALHQAEQEFRRDESRRHRNARTYHWGNLGNDIRSYFVKHQGADPESLTPIWDWERERGLSNVSETLREAAHAIANIAEEKTMTAGVVGTMTVEEQDEYSLMQSAAEFLRGRGLDVPMDAEWWEGPNAPLDYRGTVDGVPWAFELTQLREDPKKGYHRKIGNPKERKTLDEQLRAFAEVPMPIVPRGPEVLQRNLNQAFEHGRRENKTRALSRAKYCLVIHNQQFTNPEDWEKITWPDLGEINAVIFFHDQLAPPGQVWQVIPPDTFGRTVESGTVEDLERIAFADYRSGVDPTPDILDIELGFSFDPWPRNSTATDSHRTLPMHHGS